jgi:hypothetical protein
MMAENEIMRSISALQEFSGGLRGKIGENRGK